jgi:perosamine synthetase
MVPRKRIDIGWGDLACAALGCVAAWRRTRLRRQVEAAWDPRHGLACLSVRTGFDLLLGALDLPQGSEVLLSAITIPHMAELVRAHGLIPVPVDLDQATLAPAPAALAAATTARTRVVVVAHLFGGLVDLEDVSAFCRERGLHLVEDAAQAYRGVDYRGHPAAVASLFSFGPIKTSTALGGALLTVRDPALRTRMVRTRDQAPLAPRRWFAQRLLTFLGFKALGHRLPYAAFALGCARTGRDLDAVVNQGVRGFRGQGLVARVRRQAPAPLLALLLRRLKQGDAGLRARAATGHAISALLPPGLPRLGTELVDSTHWLLPVLAPDPDALVAALRRAGFDATRGGTALGVVEPPPPMAAAAMSRVVYLPVDGGLSEGEVVSLGETLASILPNPALRLVEAL